MEETVKEHQPEPPVVVTGKSKLRYPLRSATKIKEETPPLPHLFTSSTSNKGRRSVSKVSKSVGVLNVSSKEKTAKAPPRRLSTPAKSAALNVVAKSTGTITPIREARTILSKRSTSGQAKIETPLSDISSTRKKFNMLGSSSYWLSQIKLSESVSKHSISIGFFKLALEAQCQPFQRMRDELKSYVGRHEIGDDSVKELFESYNITDNQEQVQVSETCSQVPGEGTRSSDDDEVHCSSTTGGGTRKLRPRSLNAESSKVSNVREASKKEILQKNTRTPKTRSKNVEQEARKGKEEGKQMMKKEEKKSATASEQGEVSPMDNDKENVDGPIEKCSV